MKSVSVYRSVGPVVTGILLAVGSAQPASAALSSINWSPWTLQLPNNTQVSPGSTSNAWFYVSGSYQAFADPQSGICTSGSSHCRSELRERNTWSAWGNNYLNATAKVTKAPGTTAIGQVFCNSGPNGAHAQVELFYNQSGFSVFYAEAKGAGSTVGVGNAKALGTTFTYQLAFVGGKMSVKINGNTVWSRTPSSNAQSGDFYFKAGNYDQGSTCASSVSSTIRSIVQFSSLSVSH